jgi:hypothetical protein
MNKVIYNDTLSFLLPLISTNRYNKDFFINKYFIGAFLGDVDRFDYEHELLLVYKREVQIPFYEFEIELMKHPNYSGISYDYSNREYIIYVFGFPLETEEDVDTLSLGYYSKISPEAKLKIIKFWDADKAKETSKVFNIIFKTEVMRNYWIKKRIDSSELCMEDEVWPPLVYEDQLFCIENL